ncbi:MAG: hypothetical protein QXL89_04565 [Nitrososphaeria archaeon]
MSRLRFRKRSLGEPLERYVVDANVLIEYIVKDSLNRNIVEKLLDSVLNRSVELYTT